ncbi:MAG: ABC transporter ATP-binding protein/permease [Defluviitaleaceae bacterium]|nr:ABC transporter ATP-binding protein/permease [Defluviitaleaceae bacterium]
MLDIRKYKGIDVLRLPFKVSPFFVVLYFILEFVQAIVPTALLALATAFFVDTAIAIFAGEAVSNAIYLPLWLLLLIVLIINVIGSISTLVESKVRLSVERAYMPEILNVRAHLDYKHIENADSWEIVERVSQGLTERIKNGIDAYGAILRNIISILAVLGLIVTQVWWAAAVVMVISVPLFVVALYAGKKNYDAEVEAYKLERSFVYLSDEVLTNRDAADERTLFGFSDYATKQYSKKHEIARKALLKVSIKIHLFLQSTSISMAIIAFAITFALINPVITGELSPGMFMGIVAAIFGLVETLGWSLQEAAKNLSTSKEFMKDLTKFMELSRADGAADLPDKEPIVFESLEFCNVSFKYPTAKSPILNGLSFSLNAGKHYSFVGVNGAGKTTIIKLITGLYKEYDGEILINGKELRTYPAGTLKALFSVIYQDFARYQISLADNIALGDAAQEAAQEIEEEKILEIASVADLDDAIEELEDGINTPLGKIEDEGVDLSGGQWQKVAIARSLLSRAPIKILDEPTASLDPIAESRIYQEFEGLMKGKTTIFISHRLGSTKLADEIIVINNGGISERGSHDTLMEAGGIYAEMFDSQRRWYE